jgi:hypothetical protein
MNLDDVFDEETAKKLKDAVDSSVLSLHNPVHLVPKGGTISQHNSVGILRNSERGIMMDIEPETYGENVAIWKRGGEGEILCHRIAVSSFHKLEDTQDVASLCSTMADELFIITGEQTPKQQTLQSFHSDIRNVPDSFIFTTTFVLVALLFCVSRVHFGLSSWHILVFP